MHCVDDLCRRQLPGYYVVFAHLQSLTLDLEYSKLYSVPAGGMGDRLPRGHYAQQYQVARCHLGRVRGSATHHHCNQLPPSYVQFLAYLATASYHHTARVYSFVFKFAAGLMMVDFLLCVIWLPIGVSRTYGFRSASEVFTQTCAFNKLCRVPY